MTRIARERTYTKSERVTKLTFIDTAGVFPSLSEVKKMRKKKDEANILPTNIPTVVPQIFLHHRGFMSLSKVVAQHTQQQSFHGKKRKGSSSSSSRSSNNNNNSFSSYINYRDSKLTHILKGIFEGQERCFVLGCIDSKLSVLTEQMSCLRFLRQLRRLGKMTVRKQTERDLVYLLDELSKELDRLNEEKTHLYDCEGKRLEEEIEKVKHRAKEEYGNLLSCKMEMVGRLSESRIKKKDEEILEQRRTLELVKELNERNEMKLKDREMELKELENQIRRLSIEKEKQTVAVTMSKEKEIVKYRHQVRIMESVLNEQKGEIDSKNDKIKQLREQIRCYRRLVEENEVERKKIEIQNKGLKKDKVEILQKLEKSCGQRNDIVEKQLFVEPEDYKNPFVVVNDDDLKKKSRKKSKNKKNKNKSKKKELKLTNLKDSKYDKDNKHLDRRLHQVYKEKHDTLNAMRDLLDEKKYRRDNNNNSQQQLQKNKYNLKVESSQSEEDVVDESDEMNMFEFLKSKKKMMRGLSGPKDVLSYTPAKKENQDGGDDDNDNSDDSVGDACDDSVEEEDEEGNVLLEVENVF